MLYLHGTSIVACLSPYFYNLKLTSSGLSSKSFISCKSHSGREIPRGLKRHCILLARKLVSRLCRRWRNAFAQSYQAINYYRLDPLGTAKPDLLTAIKTHLAAGLPPMFGFTVYSSYTQAESTRKIPFPTSGDKIVGGHAVVAVGYDDSIKTKNTNAGAAETKGALLIRNSWGTGWGNGGYGFLPYDYVLRGLAVDWWALLKNSRIDNGNFGIS